MQVTSEVEEVGLGPASGVAPDSQFSPHFSASNSYTEGSSGVVIATARRSLPSIPCQLSYRCD